MNTNSAVLHTNLYPAHPTPLRKEKKKKEQRGDFRVNNGNEPSKILPPILGQNNDYSLFCLKSKWTNNRRPHKEGQAKQFHMLLTHLGWIIFYNVLFKKAAVIDKMA